MPNQSDKKLFLLLLLLFLGVIFFFGGSFLMKPRVILIEGFTKSINSPVPSEKEITIFLAGDIMLDRGVEYMIEKEGDGNYTFPFLKIADELNKADIVFGNLEGPISDKGTKVGSIYSFRADPKAIEGLTYAGFGVISLANNHAFDFGRIALEDTFLRLKNADINYVGGGFNESEAFSPIIREVNGVKIGFLAYTNLCPESWKAAGENSGIACISENNLEKIQTAIKSAKEKCDILIISLHSGEEYQKTPTQFQIDFFKMATESGADIVFGHHPHVVQSDLYSLGNFVFDQSFSEETIQGKMVKVIIKNKIIEEIIPIDIKINDFFQPRLEIFDTQLLPKD